VMGWAMRSGEQSARIVDKHRSAGLLFSLVTISYHIFFTFWFVPRLLWYTGTVIAIGWMFIVRWVGGGRRSRMDALVAAGVWLVSAGLFAAAWFGGDLARLPPELPPSPMALSAIALSSVLGFLLCPYLDLTFHRARRATSPAGAKVAFGLGFGVLFLLMILFSLAYAGTLITVSWSNALAGIIGVHMVLQIGFTLAVHVRAIEQESPDSHPSQKRWQNGLLAAILMGVALAAGAMLVPPDIRYRHLEVGEIVYRVYLSAYGFIFPTYAWLCMVPDRHGRSGPTREKVLASIVVMLVAAPGFWMGFIEQREIFLIPAVVVIVASRWLLGLVQLRQNIS
jgi:hypothetical protein